MPIYALRNRPLNFATAPKGWIAAGTHPDFRHGTVTYDRELSRDEMESYELILIPTDNDLATLAERCAAMARENDWTYEDEDEFRYFAPAAGQFLAEALVYADREAFARRVWAMIRPERLRVFAGDQAKE